MLLTACAGFTPVETGPRTGSLVELTACIPDLVLDIRYATANNFTGKAVYPNSRCFLDTEAACALVRVQRDLKERGYRLKVYDGYRPLSVQRAFWKILPDPKFVADPKVGSRHNRGCAVDVSLVRLDGTAVVMPTEYDDFTERAAANYAGLPRDVEERRNLLCETMERHGFQRFETEWWHFDFQGWQNRPVLDAPFESITAPSPSCPCD